MKKKEAIYEIILFSISLVLLLFSSAASAATAESGSPTVTETQITTNTSYQWDPAIYGNRIVWTDKRNGSCNIYMYDLSTKKETQISNYESGYEDTGNSAVYGDKIVWTHGYEEYWQIYMYDLSTSRETQITTNGRAYNPAIYGNKIVWLDDRDNDYKYDIYMYDLYTKKETQITSSGPADNPAIYGNRIVYADDREGNYDIYMYDISTKKETQITSSPDNQVSPAIYGNRILWKDDGGEDDGGEYHGIYMCDLSTNQKFKITSYGWDDPAIYGNRVVYTDNRNGNYDIYMSTISSEEPEPNLPVAAFSASLTYGKAPLKVKFTDTSTGTPTKWIWNFGDGSKSFHQNPTHKYSKAGVYTVSLTVKNAVGSNTVTKTEYIKVITKPVAAFSAKPTSGKAPMKVQFTDKSTGSPTKWKWDFGDGTKSFHQNPTHKYSKAGKYTVTLKVTNAVGINTATKSKYITVTSKPVAAFSASPTSGKSPLNVKFTDKSTGSPMKWKWDFGDGTKSFHQNPTHKYSKAGKYTVTLKVTNAVGINTATKSKYIIVKTSQAPTADVPTADFWGWPLSGNAPLKVTFTETSKGSPTSWKWDFGDGKYSTEKSPTHTYSAAGTYTVKLTATNAAGSSTKLKWKYIKVAK
ncbi:PKD domain-containing protein [Methanosarcina barkeri]|uniref:Cell surface protein n=3 Tax=Methanosarcina TaxID=2207 RepID=A0A0E3LMR2_METBA|nr:PKD domain-containing protein [Methanosarcina barkeri]AKB53466.1 cell surface protein [Methanosarcina barkeri MS]